MVLEIRSHGVNLEGLMAAHANVCESYDGDWLVGTARPRSETGPLITTRSQAEAELYSCCDRVNDD